MIWKKTRARCLVGALLLAIASLTFTSPGASAGATAPENAEFIEAALSEQTEVDLVQLGHDVDIDSVIERVVQAAVDAGVVSAEDARNFDLTETTASCEPGGDPLAFLINAVFCMINYYVNEAIGDVYQALDFILNHLLPLLLCLTLGNHPCF